MKRIFIMIIGLKILGLLYKILTTRILGLDGMRLISMITPTLSLCLAVSSLSIQAVCNQNIASNLRLKTTRISVIMLSCLRVTIISSSIVSILMLFSFPIYKYLYQEAFIYYPLLLCIPLLFLSNISGIMKGYLEANHQFHITYFSNILESLVKLLLTLILLIIFKDKNLHFKTILVFTSLTLSEFASNLYLSYKIKKNHKITIIKTNSYEKNVLKQAIPLTLSTLCNTIYSYIAPFIFSFACQKCGVSLYDSTTYYALVTSYAIPLLIGGQYGILTISKFIFPSITKNISNQEKQNLLLNKTFTLALLMAVLGFSICYFHAETILTIMYKDSTSAPIVHLLAPIFFFIYFDPILIIIMQSYKKEKCLFGITIFSNILSMISIFFLSQIPFFNKMGFTIGTIFGYFIKCILLFFFAIKASKFQPNFKNLIKFILLSGSYLFLLFLNSSIPYFILLSLIYFLLFVVFFYLVYNNKSNPSHKWMHKESL